MKDTQTFPAQSQEKQPGDEQAMQPQPKIIRHDYHGTGKLKNMVALITGGDSGIGRSVAVHYAREGASVAIVYVPEEQEDADVTKDMVQEEGQECLLFSGDIREEEFCREVVRETVESFGRLDILVNNAAIQFPQDSFEKVSGQQFRDTFAVNIFPHYYFTHEAIKFIKKGGSIINTTSVNSYKGNKSLVDYSATKGAITAFTRSLAYEFTEKGIRVNAVAPGPVWTPLIPASFEKEKVSTFGANTLLKRAAQPSEIGPAYVYLASKDGSFVIGQVLNINGGQFIGA